MFKGKGAEIYISFVELVLVITATAAVTFSAETVQLRANEVRVTFMSSESNKRSTGVNGKWVKPFEDRNVLSLTAWRMFTIRRSILLSLFAWPFVYGLVLVNFL
ncbi:hypothetical protein CDAR_77781 [Caerostris darwini]|uniref:Uncharacterized protein n=1 Tax=Caerostris darwini TaxID=1538125 RepID=A0AAV4NT25_9ARAC|nr:hypothetical protein CDAR_15931 [Caerostris darwini]GIX97855.1 hypothetical protein CDAR_77781 [Caerostris darwini]